MEQVPQHEPAKMDRRAYMREYRAKNRERLNAAARERSKRWRDEHPGYYQAYYQENKERITARDAAKRAVPEARMKAIEKTRLWRQEHPEAQAQWPERYGKEYTKAWRKANPEKARRNWKNGSLKKLFGLSISDFEAMLEEQGHLCAICGKPETRTWRGRPNYLSVDHNHATGVVRALLCSTCNFMIGNAHEDPDVLRAAIAYLEKHAA